jgi:hypothetical protein
MKMTTRASAIQRYGMIDLGHQVWPGQSKWLGLLEVPPELRGNWLVLGLQGSLVKHINCNVDMHLPLLNALKALASLGLTKELKTFDGCFNIRAVRGSASVSAHAYGLAIDINAFENKLGSAESKLSPAFVKCFTDQGFDWGGNFHSRKDPMHFSYCWEGSPSQENAPHLIYP